MGLGLLGLGLGLLGLGFRVRFRVRARVRVRVGVRVGASLEGDDVVIECVRVALEKEFVLQ